MITFLKNLSWVILVAAAICLPSSLYIQPSSYNPLWLTLIMATAGAVGIGLIPIFGGVIALIASRGKENGGLKRALVTTAAMSLIFSLLVIYPSIRG